MKAEILLVDDEDIILRSVNYALKKEGYKITTAKSGEEAVEKLKTANYALVITDLQMGGGMNGIEVLKEAKRINPDAFVMILTAHGTLSSVIDAKRLGADYILKPIDSLDLAARVAHCLEKREMQKQIKTLQTKLAEYEKKTEKKENPA